MLCHIAVFSWTPETTAEDVAAVMDGLREVQAAVTELRRYDFGPDLGMTAAPGDFAVVAEFDDEAGWRAYDKHPVHARVRSEVILPLVASRCTVQFSSLT